MIVSWRCAQGIDFGPLDVPCHDHSIMGYGIARVSYSVLVVAEIRFCVGIVIAAIALVCRLSNVKYVLTCRGSSWIGARGAKGYLYSSDS